MSCFAIFSLLLQQWFCSLPRLIPDDAYARRGGGGGFRGGGGGGFHGGGFRGGGMHAGRIHGGAGRVHGWWSVCGTCASFASNSRSSRLWSSGLCRARPIAGYPGRYRGYGAAAVGAAAAGAAYYGGGYYNSNCYDAYGNWICPQASIRLDAYRSQGRLRSFTTAVPVSCFCHFRVVQARPPVVSPMPRVARVTEF